MPIDIREIANKTLVEYALLTGKIIYLPLTFCSVGLRAVICDSNMSPSSIILFEFASEEDAIVHLSESIRLYKEMHKLANEDLDTMYPGQDKIWRAIGELSNRLDQLAAAQGTIANQVNRHVNHLD